MGSKNKKLDIDIEFLKQEYLDKGRSSASIARELGCAANTVHRHLRLNGVPTRPRGHVRRDIAGQRFGLLVAKEPLSRDYDDSGAVRHTKWHCRCDCGQEKAVNITLLTRGIIRCCGCSKRGVNNGNYAGTPHVSRSYWCSIQRSARARGISFEITIEEAEEILIGQNMRCALTGLPLICMTSSTNKAADWTASLDRKDSDLGYVNGNVQWIHKDINRMKWNYDEDYFIALCSAVHCFRGA